MLGFYEKFSKKQVYLGAVALLVIINILSLFIKYRLNTSFTIDEEKFTFISHSQDTVLFKDRSDNEVNIKIHKRDRTLGIDLIASKYEIAYKDMTINVDFTGYIQDRIIIESNGKERDITRDHYSRYSPSDKYSSFEERFVYNLNQTYSFVRDNQYILIVLFPIIPFAFFAFALIIYPEKMWKLDHFFTVKGGQPTEFALFANKSIGWLFVGFLLILPLII